MKTRLAKRIESDSVTQREHETQALCAVAASLGLPPLVGRRFNIGGGWASVDGFFEDDKRVFLVEVNAHVGPMKTATRNKVLKDTLKLLVISQADGGRWSSKEINRVLVFSDERARASFGEKSWGNAAFDLLGVKTQICQLSYEQRVALEKAQRHQDLRTND